MTTRREFVQCLPTLGAAFAVAGNITLNESPARAQGAAPLQGHFHPQGKAPSRHTVEVLRNARTGLPFADQRDFEEQRCGLIAPMKDMKIMADGGHVAWDMERFQFLDKQDEFDSIHPSLARIAKLNNNYGLYEVIPGIYQVRGFDLSNITFVRGKSGWIVFDPLITAEPVRAAWKLFQEHVGQGSPISGCSMMPHRCFARGLRFLVSVSCSRCRVWSRAGCFGSAASSTVKSVRRSMACARRC